MALLLVSSLVLLVIILAYTYLKRCYSRSAHDPPGAAPQFFFGNLLNSGLVTGELSIHEVMKEHQRRYGDKFLFWFGSHPCLVFCLPEHAQAIFTDRHTFDRSFFFAPHIDVLCPHGIFLLTGSKWKRHIRVMSTMFKRAKLTHYLQTIVECTDHMIDQHLYDGQVHTDLITHCQSLSLHIIGLGGFNYNLVTTSDSLFEKAFRDFTYYIALAMMCSFVPRWLIQLSTKLNWRYQRARRLIVKEIEKIVEQEQNNQNTMDDQQPKKLIASMVSSLNEEANDEQISSGLSRKEMLDEILAVFLAGYETVSTALSWAVFYLSKNPRVQQCIKDELREHNLLTKNDVNSFPSFTQEKLDSLVYCDCVAKEVLRLAPIVSIAPRIAVRDTIVDNIPIRQGQTVIVPLTNINSDSRYWHHADPTKFVPERFLEGDKNHHPYAFLPFGSGHRSCAGQDLGRLEVKLIIVRWMQRGVVFEDTPENTGGYVEEISCLPKKMAVRVRINLH